MVPTATSKVLPNQPSKRSKTWLIIPKKAALTYCRFHGSFALLLLSKPKFNAATHVAIMHKSTSVSLSIILRSNT
jgi:hypothetical protein